jgi:hypothetical protein
MSTPRSTLPRQLDAEWERLHRSPTTTAALARWGGIELALSGFDDLEGLRAAVHDRGDPAGSDRILSALVRLAAVTGHGDLLAARVVLQLLLPGAIRLARSLAGATGDPAATEAAVFAELTILIRTYPWQRRPRSTAANLLLDCRQRLSRGYARTRPEVSVGLRLGDVHPDRQNPAQRSWLEPPDAYALKDLLWWARRRGVLDPFETRLLVASHVQDIPMNELATRFGRSRSSLFMIRASAEERLRHLLRDHRHERLALADDADRLAGGHDQTAVPVGAAA